MSALTVSDIFVRVKRKFGDEASVQVTEADIYRWINDAQREMVQQMSDLIPAIHRWDAVDGEIAYFLQPEYAAVKNLYFRKSENDQYFLIKYLSMWEFNQYIDGWDGSIGSGDTPLVWTTEADLIRVFPTVTGNIFNAFKLEYSKYATLIENVNDPIEVPEYMHNAIVEYCMAQAYEMDEDWEGAQIAGARVQGDINKNNGRDDHFSKDSYPVVSTTWQDSEHY